jgi:Tol biopolymer transport system component
MCAATYLSGTAVTLTAFPNASSDFMGWSGAGCSGTENCVVNMDGPKTVSGSHKLVRIVFSSSRALGGADAANPVFNIWRMTADGADRNPVTRATAADSFEPQWSPDGTLIAFYSSRALTGADATNLPFGTHNIWRANSDGSGLMPLTRATAEDAHSGSPRWSPDGRRLAFESSRALNGTDASNLNRTSNIWTVNADGTGLTAMTNLTAAAAGSSSPQWSPSGTQLIFVSSRALNGSNSANANNISNIWRVNADGSGLIALTSVTAVNAGSFGPHWSPDGLRIVFHSPRSLNGTDTASLSSTYNIWRVNADGTGLVPVTNLTSPMLENLEGQWSPDGNQIIFRSPRALSGKDAFNPSGTLNIWRIDSAGTGLTAVTVATATSAHSFSAGWSPNGSRIVFVSIRALDGTDAANNNQTVNIWRVNADGTGLAALTDGTAKGANSSAPQTNR